MIRSWLSYVLIALIAMQSVSAVADIHQAHQTGIEHQSFDHKGILQFDTDNQATEFGEFPSDLSFDCQHCCHCHGTAHLFLNTGNYSINFAGTYYKFSNYRLAFISYQFPPDLRPPIA